MSGITARSKPAKIPFSWIEFSLDLSNVSINSGVDKQIAHEIKCPMAGVYFLSVFVVNYGTTLAWTNLYVSQNLERLLKLGMGAFTKDYAADDHAFIYCKKGDTVTMRYIYLGLPGSKVWTPKATITMMFIAHTGNSLHFCSK